MTHPSVVVRIGACLGYAYGVCHSLQALNWNHPSSVAPFLTVYNENTPSLLSLKAEVLITSIPVLFWVHVWTLTKMKGLNIVPLGYEKTQCCVKSASYPKMEFSFPTFQDRLSLPSIPPQDKGPTFLELCHDWPRLLEFIFPYLRNSVMAHSWQCFQIEILQFF